MLFDRIQIKTNIPKLTLRTWVKIARMHFNKIENTFLKEM